MNTAVWIVSGLLAATYLMAGTLKTTQPVDKLRPQMGWVDDISLRTLRLIGTLELLGALGLILPKLLDVVDERGGSRRHPDGARRGGAGGHPAARHPGARTPRRGRQDTDQPGPGRSGRLRGDRAVRLALSVTIRKNLCPNCANRCITCRSGCSIEPAPRSFQRSKGGTQ